MWSAIENICTVECGTSQSIMSDKLIDFKNVSLFRGDTHTTASDERTRWPTSTDISCFYCAHPFDGVPVSIPVNFDKASSRWETDGVFCSVPCALAYLADYEHHDYQFANKICWLRYFAKTYFGCKNALSCKRAPSRRLLRKFGGHMSIEDFRSTDSDTVMLQREPFVSFSRVTSLRKSEEEHSDVYLGQTTGIGFQSRFSKFKENQKNTHLIE